MDIVSRVCQRYAQKLQAAYTTDPRRVEPQFKALDDALHFLAAGVGTGDDPAQGSMFQSYSMAIDAFREILYYLRKVGVGEWLESKVHNLAAMSKLPFAPDEVLQHQGPHVFVRALGEAHLLSEAFQKVKAGAGAPAVHP